MGTPKNICEKGGWGPPLSFLTTVLWGSHPPFSLFNLQCWDINWISSGSYCNYIKFPGELPTFKNGLHLWSPWCLFQGPSQIQGFLPQIFYHLTFRFEQCGEAYLKVYIHHSIPRWFQLFWRLRLRGPEEVYLIPVGFCLISKLSLHLICQNQTLILLEVSIIKTINRPAEQTRAIL